MKIDLKEIMPLIDPADFPEGKFNRHIQLPDGRSVTLKGNVHYQGHRIHHYNDPDDDGFFSGTVDFTLSDWTGYDPEGNVIPVVNSTWFENRMQVLLIESL